MKPRSRYRGLSLFVTVGSTRFDTFIKRILCEESAEQLTELGFARLVLQVGKSEYDLQLVELIREQYNLDIEIYEYKDSIKDDIERADVVIGHAGAGTCLEVLRMNKRLLLVVNENLMDNHQSELADQLATDKYVIKTNVDDLTLRIEEICNSATKLSKFPAENAALFEGIYEEAFKDATSR